MRKILFLLVMAFTFISCNEKEDAIDRFMFENLYDYDSYQVIEMKDIGNTFVELKFRCKSAGGIFKINKWIFHFNDDGSIGTVRDENETDPMKTFIYIGGSGN